MPNYIDHKNNPSLDSIVEYHYSKVSGFSDS